MPTHDIIFGMNPTKHPQSHKSPPTIAYLVAMPSPASHLFEITLEIGNWRSPVLDLKMPVWCPGSYLVREYSRHLQDFTATARDSSLPLPSRKLSKNHWQLSTKDIAAITIRYRVFANDLTVRTNHLDTTHGYFNGAALFFYLPGWEKQRIRVKIATPYPHWQVTTPLPELEGSPHTFEAEDFDTLVDSPFEIGSHQVYNFEVLGKSHQLAIWGKGNAQAEKIIEDTKKIIATEAALYGELPYDRYLFLLHLSHQGFGGLEHKNCCSLNYPRFGFRKTGQYNRFMQLITHEFFHLWNIKRIRPKALEEFDYDRENYTTSLWFCEGVTSYYDMVIPLRAKIYDIPTFLEILSKEISRFLTTPGRKVQPLHESSFDAWIKLYRRDAHSDNSQISYYLKGEMVSLVLDLLIRSRHENRRSLDHVMKQMWQDFGKDEIGYTPSQLQAVIESVAGIDLTDFFARYIHGTDELPLAQYLSYFGLVLSPVMEKEPVPYLGIKAKVENGSDKILFVTAGSPAAVAGIDPGSELLALDGIRVTAEQLNERLGNYRAGDTVAITLFHGDELKTLAVTLAESQPSRYQVVTCTHPTGSQKQNFAGWLRQ